VVAAGVSRAVVCDGAIDQRRSIATSTPARRLAETPPRRRCEYSACVIDVVFDHEQREGGISLNSAKQVVGMEIANRGEMSVISAWNSNSDSWRDSGVI
jgi:hypothetical protein